MRLIPALLAAVLSLPAIAGAQSPIPVPPPPPDPLQEPAPKPEDAPLEAPPETVKLGVELVQVDVVVTDKRGDRVTDLRPEEFEIYENGVLQEITNFSYVAVDPSSSIRVRRKGERDEPIPPPRKLRASDVRRAFALVVDDLFLSFEHVLSVKTAIRKFVDEQMRPDDLVAVVVTSKGSSSLQQFTNDKRLLHLAVDRIAWNPRGARGIQTFDTYGKDLEKYSILRNRWERGEGGIDTSRQTATAQIPNHAGPRPDGVEMSNDTRDDIFAVGSLGALDYVVRSLGDVPGRKSLVWFTEGFELIRSEAPNQLDELRRQGIKNEETRALELTRRLADRTNRAGVVFYPVDVRGLTVPYLVGADADGFDKPLSERSREMERKEQKRRSSQDVMRYLANSTGGFVYSANDPVVGVRRIMEDQGGFYFIGYVPPKLAAQPGAAPKFNEIEVKVKRPGVKVRSRTGFFAPTTAAATEAAKTPAQRLVDAILAPVGAAGVDVELSTQFLPDPEKGIVVRSMLHVDADDLTFTANEDGSATAHFDVVAFASGESGAVESITYETQTFRVPADQLEEVRRHGIVYTINLPIEKHGPYQVRTAVRDLATERIGSASEFLVVPDPAEQRLAVSGVALKGEASIARFVPGTDVTYYFAVYNPKVDAQTSRARLGLKISLWRDGKLVFESENTEIVLANQADWTRVNAVGSFRLSERAEPGAYTLQVDVVDMVETKRKEGSATQYVNFEVVGS